jgi:hypothetical protein
MLIKVIKNRRAVMNFRAVMFALLLSTQAFSQELPVGTDQISGQLVVTVADYFSEDKSETKYFIKDSNNGEIFEVFLDGEQNQILQTGASVQAHGKLNGHSLEAAQITVTSFRPLVTGSTLKNMPLITPVTGVQKTLVVILETSSSASKITNKLLSTLMFSQNSLSVNTYYKENSFSAVSIQGDVVGPYIINAPTTCDWANIQKQAEEAASAAGVAVSDYPRRIYMMPNEMSNICAPAGFTSSGGSPSFSWINTGDFSPYDTSLIVAIGHEMGHQMSMLHAQAIKSDKSIDEYGDNSCLMGDASYNVIEFNVPHRIQMGWIPLSNIRQVDSSGIYQVTYSEVQTNQFQALQIILPGSIGTPIYVSYRLPVKGSLDSRLLPSFTSGASIHLWSGGVNQTKLATNYPWGGALTDGQTYNSPDGTVSITQLTHDDTTVTVSVKVIDTTPPTAPANLNAILWGRRAPYRGQGEMPSLKLSWQASKDDVGVAGYYVFRDNVKYDTTTSTEMIIPLLPSDNHTHTYYVVAYDAAGNVSSASNVLSYPVFK